MDDQAGSGGESSGACRCHAVQAGDKLEPRAVPGRHEQWLQHTDFTDRFDQISEVVVYLAIALLLERVDPLDRNLPNSLERRVSHDLLHIMGRMSHPKRLGQTLAGGGTGHMGE